MHFGKQWHLRSHCGVCAVIASETPRTSAGSSRKDSRRVLTVKEAQLVASSRGLDLRITTIGPAYEVSCRDGSSSGPVLGTSSGIVLAPLKLLHCDKMEIFARRRQGADGQRIRGGMLGLGLLIAMTVFAHGYASGCRTAEILAINDDDRWHERLVRHYSKMYGFYTIKEVTGRLAEIPDMLVWGGVGTRMNTDLESQLLRWTPALLQNINKET